MKIRINDHLVDVEENDSIVVERDGDAPFSVIVVRHAEVVLCLEIG